MNIDIVQHFVNERKKIIIEGGHLPERVWCIIIDRNDEVRYSESISILEPENIKIRILCIEEYCAPVRCSSNISIHPTFYIIYPNGDIHNEIFIDGWRLDFRILEIKHDNGFFLYVNNKPSRTESLNHFWKTFNAIKTCKTRVEMDCFKKLYEMNSDKEKYLTEIREKKSEIEYLKTQIKNLENLFQQISDLVNTEKDSVK